MRTWTDSEVAILLDNYNAVTNSVLHKLIPNKSPKAIYKKAYKMGLRKTSGIEFQNRSEVRKGEKGSNWKGGRRKTSGGYIQLLIPEHPRADKSGYVMEHIVIWEEKTGMNLPNGFCIHHLNEDKTDNRIENLCLMLHSAHTVFHHSGKKRAQETRDKISKARRRQYGS